MCKHCYKAWNPPMGIWNLQKLYLSLEHTLTDSDIYSLLKEFDDEFSPTTQYWRDYMKMTSLLLQFIRVQKMLDRKYTYRKYCLMS